MTRGLLAGRRGEDQAAVGVQDGGACVCCGNLGDVSVGSVHSVA